MGKRSTWDSAWMRVFILSPEPPVPLSQCSCVFLATSLQYPTTDLNTVSSE